MYEAHDTKTTTVARRFTSAAERTALLDYQVNRMSYDGYYLLMRFDDRVFLARDGSTSIIEIFADESGELWFA
jgi:hypothetical protein